MSFSEPGFTELPSVAPGAIQCLFQKVGVDVVNRCLKILLSDEPLRIFGKDRNELYLCCEALRCLLYPFNFAPDTSGNRKYMSYISLRDFKLSRVLNAGIFGIDQKLEEKAYVCRECHVL